MASSSIWVDSLVLSDATDVIQTLRDNAIVFNVYPSNSAIAPSKLVIAFGPAAPVKDIKAVVSALRTAYITFVPGESSVYQIVFVGAEAYDDKTIIPVQRIYEAIVAASDINHIVQVVPHQRNANG